MVSKSGVWTTGYTWHAMSRWACDSVRVQLAPGFGRTDNSDHGSPRQNRLRGQAAYGDVDRLAGEEQLRAQPPPEN
jgi:hypothetical protein